MKLAAHTNTLGKSHRIALAPIFYASVFVYFKVKNYLLRLINNFKNKPNSFAKLRR